jgi:hypothetical protein
MIRHTKRKTETTFGSRNFRRLYRSGLLKAVSRELANYSLDVMGVEENRWNQGGTDQTLQRGPDRMAVSSSPKMYILPCVDM